MLRPSPLFPLLISMVVSRPGIMGQEAGSCMTVAAVGVSDGRWRLGDDDEKMGVTETGTTGWWTDDAAACADDWCMEGTFTWAGDTWFWRAGDDVSASEISDLWLAETSATIKTQCHQFLPWSVCLSARILKKLSRFRWVLEGWGVVQRTITDNSPSPSATSYVNGSISNRGLKPNYANIASKNVLLLCCFTLWYASRSMKFGTCHCPLLSIYGSSFG